MNHQLAVQEFKESMVHGPWSMASLSMLAKLIQLLVFAALFLVRPVRGQHCNTSSAQAVNLTRFIFQGNLGLGNTLSRYWHARAMRRFAGKPFVMAKPTADVLPLGKRGEGWGAVSSWAAQLRVRVPAAPRLERELESAGRAPDAYPHAAAGSWVQGAMLATIRNESEHALAAHFAAARGSRPLRASQADVAIHLRCGDILAQPHLSYGFISFEWYRKQIPAGARRVYIVGNVNARSTRGKDQGSQALGRCASITAGLVKYLKRHARIDARVVPADVSSDFALMVNAGTLIAGLSTFSFWAALVRRPASGEGAPLRTVLPQCHLFFNCNTPALPGITWARGVPVLYAAEIHAHKMSGKEIVKRLSRRMSAFKSLRELPGGAAYHCRSEVSLELED